MEKFILFARHTAIDDWLDQNPLILGLLAIVVALAVGGWGVFELYKGVAYTKYGKEVRGPQAKAASIIAIALGAVFLLFGLYKIFFG